MGNDRDDDIEIDLLEGNKAKAKNGLGPCSKIDLGIVKYHFEIGAGKDNFEWLEE